MNILLCLVTILRAHDVTSTAVLTLRPILLPAFVATASNFMTIHTDNDDNDDYYHHYYHNGALLNICTNSSSFHASD
jgi:hypothetical protein